MHQSRLWTLVRAVGLLAGCAATGGTAWWLTGDLLWPVLAGHGAPGLASVSFAEALDAVCAAVLLGCVGWLVLGTTLTVASYAAAVLSPASPATAALDMMANRGCPRRLRRLVLAFLGVAIGAGAVAPATAQPVGLTDRPGAHVTAADRGVSGLTLPDRTTGSMRAAAPPAAEPISSPHTERADSQHAERARPGGRVATVLVEPGDSLWAIASDLLPPGASDHAVSVAWHHLHQANRSRIGADPDLILPGTRLRVPDQLPTEREER